MSSLRSFFTGDGLSIIETANFNFIPNTTHHYVDSTATGTLPPTPAVGTRCYFITGSNLVLLTIARNGQLIEGVADNMTVSTPRLSGGLVYLGGAKGWETFGSSPPGVAGADGADGFTPLLRYITVADSPVTAAYGDDLVCDSTGGAILINLPAAIINQYPITVRAGGSAATNNVTVEPDGAETILGETNLQIDINHFSASFAAKAGAWV